MTHAPVVVRYMSVKNRRSCFNSRKEGRTARKYNWPWNGRQQDLHHRKQPSLIESEAKISKKILRAESFKYLQLEVIWNYEVNWRGIKASGLCLPWDLTQLYRYTLISTDFKMDKNTSGKSCLYNMPTLWYSNSFITSHRNKCESFRGL